MNNYSYNLSSKELYSLSNSETEYHLGQNFNKTLQRLESDASSTRRLFRVRLTVVLNSFHPSLFRLCILRKLIKNF
jgi:hypothetical protein